jgi:cleavage and polyadenylation specificity factor subunit 1
VPCNSKKSRTPGSLSPFLQKLNPTQQKCSTYDRELLAIYDTVKHFRHMLEVRLFIFFTDYKRITHVFQQKESRTRPTDRLDIPLRLLPDHYY